MRADRIWLMTFFLLGVSAGPALARERSDGSRDRDLVETVHEAWEGVVAVVQQIRETARRSGGVTPQKIPSAPDAPIVQLNDLSRTAEIESAIAAARSRKPLRIQIPGGQARIGDFTIGSDQVVEGHLLLLDGDADIHGKLNGNLVTANGGVTVHPGGIVTGDAFAIDGEVKALEGVIEGQALSVASAVPAPEAAAPVLAPAQIALRSFAGVAGIFLSLLALGFALVVFARPNLEVVSDTAANSFGRSFLTGLLGQVLLLPTFGMVIVGLLLSVAGILLVPFAVILYALLVIVGVLGGFLAVAHAMGETYTRRQLAQGQVGATNSFRYLLLGLSLPVGLGLAWSAVSWVPVAGPLVGSAALLLTWLLATTGFGAALLSRAGIREHFAGRIFPPEALTDEYLWATPQYGVPAIKGESATQRRAREGR